MAARFLQRWWRNHRLRWLLGRRRGVIAFWLARELRRVLHATAVALQCCWMARQLRRRVRERRAATVLCALAHGKVARRAAAFARARTAAAERARLELGVASGAAVVVESQVTRGIPSDDDGGSLKLDFLFPSGGIADLEAQRDNSCKEGSVDPRRSAGDILAANPVAGS